ncbi:lysozyme inhibitor LprI family protein [Chromobacterium phragmitis]|nr:lysozyme inhibitor LprI family protein [Chromobacterium phragmitis]
MKPCLLALLALFASHAALAEDDPCKEASNTIEINECMQKQFDGKDRLLNDRYRELLQKLRADEARDKPAAKEKPSAMLVQAQRKWIAFRDADCGAKYQIYAGGTIRNAVFLGCKIERTEQRIKELEPKLW